METSPQCEGLVRVIESYLRFLQHYDSNGFFAFVTRLTMAAKGYVHADISLLTRFAELCANLNAQVNTLPNNLFRSLPPDHPTLAGPRREMTRLMVDFLTEVQGEEYVCPVEYQPAAYAVQAAPEPPPPAEEPPAPVEEAAIVPDEPLPHQDDDAPIDTLPPVFTPLPPLVDEPPLTDALSPWEALPPVADELPQPDMTPEPSLDVPDVPYPTYLTPVDDEDDAPLQELPAEAVLPLYGNAVPPYTASYTETLPAYEETLPPYSDTVAAYAESPVPADDDYAAPPPLRSTEQLLNDPLVMRMALTAYQRSLPDELQAFTEGLMALARELETGSGGIETRLAGIEQYVYTAPKSAAVLMLYPAPEAVTYVTLYGNTLAFTDADWLRAIAVVQCWAHEQLLALGIEPIYPPSGERYDANLHESSERDIVWVNNNPALHNTIESLVRMGFRAGDGHTLRRAVVRRYLFMTAEDAAPPAAEPAPAPDAPDTPLPTAEPPAQDADAPAQAPDEDNDNWLRQFKRYT